MTGLGLYRPWGVHEHRVTGLVKRAFVARD